MSPKVKEQEQKNNNIKNIYIQKINSLMKLSKDTIGKSQIEALNQTNRKKIKKHLSEVEKNTIRLEKNRQSAKKARERKKIYVKLLQQQERKLNEVLQKTQKIERISSEYVNYLQKKKKDLISTETNLSGAHNNLNKIRRKSSDNDMIIQNNLEKKNLRGDKLENKIILLKQIIQELTELSKYAYWKQNKRFDLESENMQSNGNQERLISEEQQQQHNLKKQEQEEDFFNIQQVLADIQVVQMKNNNQNLDAMNLDDLLNVPFEDESQDREKERYDIKTLIGDQYETVNRCLLELDQINLEAQNLLKISAVYKKNHAVAEDIKNPQLAEFKKKNTIVPEYEIKKIKPRRIDSFNSLSSANRSMMSRCRSLFSLNNYFINMEQAEAKILTIDRAIQQIGRILEVKEEDEKQQQFSQKN